MALTKNRGAVTPDKIQDNDKTNSLVINSATGQLEFTTNNTLQGILNSTGDLILGTGTGASGIEVVRSSASTDFGLKLTNNANGDIKLTMETAAQTFSLGIDNSDNDYLKLSTSSTDVNTGTLWTITNDGSLGIGVVPTSKLHVDGSISQTISSISSATTLDNTHSIVQADATAGAFTIALPAASTCPGRIYTITKIDSSANAVTIDPNGTETIQGALTKDLTGQYDRVVLRCDGTGWLVEGSNNLENATILFDDGSETSPSITFVNDTNTGVYRVGTDTLGLVTGGVEKVRIGTHFTSFGRIFAIDGSASLPSISFSSDADTGIFAPAAETLGFTTAGSERLRIDSAGNIAIGNVSPGSKLAVEAGGTANSGIQLVQTGTGGRDFRFESTGSSYVGGAGNLALIDANVGETRFLINSSGNVGINTTNPTAKLEIEASSNGSGLGFLLNHDTRATGEEVFRVGAFDGSFSTLSVVSGANNVGKVGINTNSPSTSSFLTIEGGNGLLLRSGVNSDSNIDFITTLGNWRAGVGVFTSTDCFNIYDVNASAERLRIDSVGNVGIGSTNPTEKLEVDGQILATGGVNSDRAVIFDKGGVTGYYGVGAGPFDGISTTWLFANANFAASAVGLGFDNNGTITPYLTVRPSGNVGIGTITPSALLHVDYGAGSGNIQLDNAAGTLGGLLINSGSNSVEFSNNPSGEAIIRVALDTKLRINNSGIFITPTNTANLELTNDGTYSFLINNPSADAGASITYNTKNVHAFQTDSVERLRISSSGIDFNSHKGINLLDPTNAQDAATKAYVDSIAAGLDPKESVVAATTSNLSGYSAVGGTSGTGAFSNIDTTTFDGHTMALSDRVLVLNQTDQTQNGIYVITTLNATTGAMERATDHDGTPSNEVSGGNTTFVENGTTYSGRTYALQGDGVLTLNTDNLVWQLLSTAQDWTWGTGLTATGNTINLTANLTDLQDVSTSSLATGQMLYKSAGDWNNASNLYWDEVNDRLAIGNSSPTVSFEIARNEPTILLNNNVSSVGLTLRSLSSENQIYSSTNHNLCIYTNGNANQLCLDQSTGNVGIGTSSPGAGLEVRETDGGSSIIRVTSNSTSLNAALEFNDSSTARWGFNFINSDDSLRFTASTLDVMTLTQSGNVGIGNTSPKVPLQINNYGGLDGNANQFIIRGNTYFDDLVDIRPESLKAGFSNEIELHSDDGSIRFKNSSTAATGADEAITNTERLRLDNTGRALYLNGPIASSVSNTESLQVWYDSGNQAGRLYAGDGTTNRDILIGGDGFNEALRIKGDTGNVGIGTSSPVDKLVVDSGSDTNIALFRGGSTRQLRIGTTSTIAYINADNTSDGLAFNVNTTEYMRIDTSGNVGIGGTPTNKLDVFAVNHAGVAQSDIQITVPDTIGNRAGFGLINSSGGFIGGLAGEVVTTGVYPNSSGKIDLFVQNGAGTTTALTALANGNVGIGTSNPYAKLEISSGANTSAIRVSDSNHDGSTSTFKYTLGSYWARRDNNVRTNSDPLSTSGSTAAIVFTDEPGNGPNFQNQVRSSSIEFWTADNFDGTNLGIYPKQRMIIDSAGKVGIGAISPARALEISVSSDVPAIRLTRETPIVGSYTGIEFIGGSDINSQIRAYQEAAAASDLRFYTNSGGVFERMRIDSAGNVGIGTSSPAEKLDVNEGKIQITNSNASAFDTYQVYGSGMPADEKYWRQQITPGNLLFQTVNDAYSAANTWLRAFRSGNQITDIAFFTGTSGTSEKVRIDSAGNVGIGTTSPLAKLDVISSTGSVGFNAGTSVSPERGNLFYDTDGTGWKFNIGKFQSGTFTPQMTFVDNGNVGIGSDDPGYKLEVSNIADEIFNLKRPGIGEWLQGINSSNSYTLSRLGTSNYFVVDTNGNVGIGTSSPSEALDIEKGGATTAGISLNQTGPSGKDYRIASTGSGYGDAGHLVFYDATAAVERVRINNVGDLLIGQTTAGSFNSRLNVVKNSTTNNPFGITNASTIRLQCNVFNEGTIGAMYLSQDGGGNGYIGVTRPTADLLLLAGNAEAMRIDSSGNVGIGTTNPEARFHVSGGSCLFDNNFGLNFKDSGGSARNGVVWDSLDNLNLYSGTDNTIKLRIDSSGNVGVGVTSIQSAATGNTLETSGPLVVGGRILSNQTNRGVLEYDSNLVQLRAFGATTGSGVITFKTGGGGGSADSEAVRIDSSGNMLIGGTASATNASKTLHIFNGGVPISSVTDGVILYSEDVSSSAELKVRDEAGNITTLSPHNFSLIPEGPSEDMAWAYYSEKNGKRINVDMLKLARLIEKLTGEKLVYEDES